jgi:hypothetical protein
MARKGRARDVPETSHPPLRQGGLVLGHARNAAGARAVRDYLLSADGRALLVRNGFGIPSR